MMDLTHPLNCLMFNLQRASRSLVRRFEMAAKQSGLTAPQFTTLALIAGHGEVSISRLAEQLGTDRTTMTRNLDLLTQRGWVTEAESGDARVRLVRLTNIGQRKLDQAMPVWSAFQGHLVASMGEAAARTLLTTLTNI
jgi:DNA-binding MarR family transcriptional regulator